MNVRLRLVWRVILDDPINSRYVETTGRYIGREQDARRGGTELEESGRALVLLLVAMQVEDGQVDVVEELGVVLDRVARGEEDDHLFLQILAQKCEEQQEAARGFAHDKALLERRNGCRLRGLLRGDVDTLLLDCKPRERRDVLRLSGREERGLPILLWEELDDRTEILLEADLKDAVCLIDHKHLHVGEDEPLCAREVVEEPPWRRH
mmetsp:Transcript_48830/g.104228  ORF Transcript_48830/g.104228 Transcript_48830/m.104228 type:complete len:208 (+) Transcript_48830:703-1326(+)